MKIIALSLLFVAATAKKPSCETKCIKDLQYLNSTGCCTFYGGECHPCDPLHGPTCASGLTCTDSICANKDTKKRDCGSKCGASSPLICDSNKYADYVECKCVKSDAVCLERGDEKDCSKCKEDCECKSGSSCVEVTWMKDGKKKKEKFCYKSKDADKCVKNRK
jgi:hypothetical protein